MTAAAKNAALATARAGNIFPKQLLEIMSDRHADGVIEWLAHGHAFAIKNPERFVTELMPRFTRGKLTSFQRQLNLYGFRKVTKGADCKAGALVYFHPAFKRGRPEMMKGIKRIACKGELSLNRLRNDDVPYDPSVPSEETEAPELDVNILHKASRKRFRAWHNEDAASKRPLHVESCAPADAHTAGALSPIDSFAGVLYSAGDEHSVGHIKPDMLAAGLDAVLEPDYAVRPAALPIMELHELPTKATRYGYHDAAPVGDVLRAYARQAMPEAAHDFGCSTPPTRPAHSPVSGTDPGRFTFQPEEVMLPQWMNAPMHPQVAVQPGGLRMADMIRRGADQLIMPPARPKYGDKAAEELMPLPFDLSSSPAPLLVPPKLNFVKGSGVRMAPPESEVLMRNISEVSGCSNASDLWWGLEDLEGDVDLAALFE